MSKYLNQKAHLEEQGWFGYESKGGKTYFRKNDIAGLVVEVDQVTGEAKLQVGCPPSFAEKHAPTFITK